MGDGHKNTWETDTQCGGVQACLRCVCIPAVIVRGGASRGKVRYGSTQSLHTYSLEPLDLYLASTHTCTHIHKHQSVN